MTTVEEGRTQAVMKTGGLLLKLMLTCTSRAVWRDTVKTQTIGIARSKVDGSEIASSYAISEHN